MLQRCALWQQTKGTTARLARKLHGSGRPAPQSGNAYPEKLASDKPFGCRRRRLLLGIGRRERVYLGSESSRPRTPRATWRINSAVRFHAATVSTSLPERHHPLTKTRIVLLSPRSGARSVAHPSAHHGSPFGALHRRCRSDPSLAAAAPTRNGGRKDKKGGIQCPINVLFYQSVARILGSAPLPTSVANRRRTHRRLPLTAGPGVACAVAGAGGATFVHLFRKHYRLANFGRAATYLPCVVLPAMGALLSQGLVTSDLVLLDTKCISCVQLRAAALQLFFGFLYPALTVPVACIGLALRYNTYALPPLRTHYRHVVSDAAAALRKRSSRVKAVLGFQCAASFLLLHLQMNSVLKVHTRLSRME